jgi:hypothetical protein
VGRWGGQIRQRALGPYVKPTDPGVNDPLAPHFLLRQRLTPSHARCEGGQHRTDSLQLLCVPQHAGFTSVPAGHIQPPGGLPLPLSSLRRPAGDARASRDLSASARPSTPPVVPSLGPRARGTRSQLNSPLRSPPRQNAPPRNHTSFIPSTIRSAGRGSSTGPTARRWRRRTWACSSRCTTTPRPS